MKKYLPLTILMAVCFVFCRPAYAEDIVHISTMTMGAQVPLITDMSVSIKTIGYNQQVSSITWQDQILGAGWQRADMYVELDVSCNMFAWEVDIYTNNTNASNSMLQKGGLMCATTNTVRLPLAWIISDSTIPVINCGEPGELLTNEITGIDTLTGASTTTLATWRYIKDMGDVDDVNTTSWNESWEDARSKGYAAGVVGMGSRASMPYFKQSSLIQGKTPFVIYFQGEFNYINADTSYSGTIVIDLVHR